VREVAGAAIVLGFVIAAVFATASIVQNRSDERFFFQGKLFNSLVEQINTHAGSGRAFFSGFVLHEVGGSHIAPMTLFTDKPIMASDPIHRYWQRVEAIPAEYRERGQDGIEEYLDLFNVTVVFAHERDRIKYFRQHPERYQHVWKQRRFHAFVRKSQNQSGYFYRGSGEIKSQNVDHIVVVPNTPEVIVKFRYVPILESSNCAVSEARVGEGVSLIKLSGCVVGKPAIIRIKSIWKRVSEG
jgi:hypothetical protein